MIISLGWKFIAGRVVDDKEWSSEDFESSGSFHQGEDRPRGERQHLAAPIQLDGGRKSQVEERRKIAQRSYRQVGS